MIECLKKFDLLLLKILSFEFQPILSQQALLSDTYKNLDQNVQHFHHLVYLKCHHQNHQHLLSYTLNYHSAKIIQIASYYYEVKMDVIRKKNVCQETSRMRYLPVLEGRLKYYFPEVEIVLDIEVVPLFGFVGRGLTL